MRVLSHRLYDAENPPSWCVWRWRSIHAEIGPKPYLLRLYLLMTQLFSVCLHWINDRDPDDDPHDHQRSFVSVVLRGWYREEVHDGLLTGGVEFSPRVQLVRWFNFKRSTDAHRIVEVAPGTLTLVFNGPRMKTWHFWVKTPLFGLGRMPIEHQLYPNPVRAKS